MVNYITLSADALDKLLDDNDIEYTAETTRKEKIKLHKDFIAAQNGGDAPNPDTDTDEGKDKEDEKDPGEDTGKEKEKEPSSVEKPKEKTGKFRKEYTVTSPIQTGDKFYPIGSKFPGYAGCEKDLAHALDI